MRGSRQLAIINLILSILISVVVNMATSTLNVAEDYAWIVWIMLTILVVCNIAIIAVPRKNAAHANESEDSKDLQPEVKQIPVVRSEAKPRIRLTQKLFADSAMLMLWCLYGVFAVVTAYYTALFHQHLLGGSGWLIGGFVGFYFFSTAFDFRFLDAKRYRASYLLAIFLWIVSWLLGTLSMLGYLVPEVMSNLYFVLVIGLLTALVIVGGLPYGMSRLSDFVKTLPEK